MPEKTSGFVVSIEPLKYLIDNIVGDDFEVTVLVPSGASPETYEPVPAQIRAVEEANLLFFTGLIDFERELIERISAEANQRSNRRFVDLGAGVELIDNQHVHEHENEKEHAGYGHPGADPHVWMSPRALAQMAETAYLRIHELYPDSVSYSTNYERLAERLRELDREVGERLADRNGRAFMIFHPGLTYFARDYKLRQIAIEYDAKEPSVKQLQEILDIARRENITQIFYQREFPRTIVEVAAAEIGAELVEIDILGYDVEGNIQTITELLTK